LLLVVLLLVQCTQCPELSSCSCACLSSSRRCSQLQKCQCPRKNTHVCAVNWPMKTCRQPPF